MQLIFLSQIKMNSFYVGTVNQCYSVIMLLAGKCFLIDLIQSPDLQRDSYQSKGFLIRPWMLTVQVFVILGIWWYYLVQLRLKFPS